MNTFLPDYDRETGIAPAGLIERVRAVKYLKTAGETACQMPFISQLFTGAPVSRRGSGRGYVTALASEGRAAIISTS